DFDIADVINNICDKIIYRHPHIYADVKVKNATEVASNWEDLKLKDGERKRVLEGVPKSLPALIKAYRIQEKVKGVGFDWKEKEQVWDKVREELSELTDEIKRTDNKDRIESEFGDLFFSIINAARLYNVDPEIALEKTNRKFIKRFNFLEDKTMLIGKSLRNMTLNEMEEIWQESKKHE
ncbi:MAG: nucleoside triphosphate pyrophosphohydrolase, partial [Flavobacteriaceae bacterium]|nr:nucleoside triphosphate pyrophosphohydrolase [Flavobacteriaceae bacterium]